MLGLKWIGASSKHWLPRSASFALLLQQWGMPVLPSSAAPIVAQSPAIAICTESAADATLWFPATAVATVTQLLDDWQQHPLFPLFDCLTLRSYQATTDLQCKTEGERLRARCEPALLPRELDQRQIILTDTPTASADATQMVLPLDTDVDLMAHEVGHWLGFADEYPMSVKLAESFCQGRYQHASLNVVLTDTTEMSTGALRALWQQLPWRNAVPDWRQLGEQQANGRWRLGSSTQQKIGLFHSPTCANVEGVFSWKPVAEWTAMQYHDVNYWPELYLSLAKAYLAGLDSGLRDHDHWTQQGE
ncbi:hypothetical protein [Pseudidiomarina salilacus]|uniref:hypothetical protein n=1 Tax=Pseudidiomarina salilacus TaxID=3384452 RepID=UPI0039850E0E